MKTSKNKVIIALLASGFLMTNAVNYFPAGSCYASITTLKKEHVLNGIIELSSIENSKELERISIITGKLLSLDDNCKPINFRKKSRIDKFIEDFSCLRICKIAGIPGYSIEQNLSIIANNVRKLNIINNGKFCSQYTKQQATLLENMSLKLIADNTNCDVCLITVHDGKFTCPYFLKGIKYATPNKQQIKSHQ